MLAGTRRRYIEEFRIEAVRIGVHRARVEGEHHRKIHPATAGPCVESSSALRRHSTIGYYSPAEFEARTAVA